MGDGDHGWSAAEFLNLVREMLVSDRGGQLRLAEYAPHSWFKPGMHLESSGAPTLHGTVSYTVRQGPVAAFLTWSVHRAPHQPPAPIRFSLPVASGLAPEFPCPVDGGCYRVPLAGESGSVTFPTARPADPTTAAYSRKRTQHA